MFLIQYDNGYSYSDNDHFPICYVDSEVEAKKVVELANSGNSKIISLLQEAYKKAYKSEYGITFESGYFYYTKVFNLKTFI